MSYNEILKSGLLELYVLGKLTEEEAQTVEEAIVKFPQLRQEIQAIDLTILKYDYLHKKEAPSNILDKILENTSGTITEDDNKRYQTININKYLIVGLGLALLGSMIYSLQKKGSLINK